MKKIYFRILAICLSLVLSFTILYKDSIQADALEWVGVAVGYDTAFKFLLGLLGVSVGVGVAQEIDWGQLRQDCTQVMIDQGASQVEASQWWADVIHGSLDTASSCWDSFKDYVSSLVSSSSGGNTFVALPLSEAISLFNEKFNTHYALGSNQGVNDYCYAIAFKFKNSQIVSQSVKFYTTPKTYVLEFSDYVYISGYTSWYTGLDSGNLGYSNGNGDIFFYQSSIPNDTLLYLSDNFTYSNDFNIVPFSLNDVASDFSSAYSDIGDIALNPENADTLATDVIPLPWENIGASDTDIEGIIDDAISRVIDGTLSLENYWEYVQNITNTYAYSIENNYLLPNENGEDKKADDKVKENAENGAFVLYGLEKVFPFCIPFDIYAFITLLKADPVAPVIEYPIYNPVTQENEIITIDFSEWESVVIIFRYIFDFLLIIGLLLLARPLVGAGGDS